jgi:DNA-binding NarL/FixJ family response regulator
MISVLLADDHPLILRGIRELLAGEPDLAVVGEESDSTRVAEAVERLEPDVLIQDLSMSGGISGFEVIRGVKELRPATRVVVLTMFSTLASVYEALHQGAAAFVSKLEDMQQLIDAVRSVVANARYIGRPFTEEQLNEYARQLGRRRIGPLGVLTRRELEVLSMVAHGRTSNEIAEELRIGRRTVESHRASMLSKLGVRNQAEVVRYALERGLVAPC